MKIEALCSINSGQANKGDILDLPDAQAKGLIKAGAAKAVTTIKKAQKKLVSPQDEKKKIADEHKSNKDAKANEKATAGSAGASAGEKGDK